MIPSLTWAIRGLFAASLASLLVAQLALAGYSWSLFGERITPELHRKGELLAQSVSRKVGKALSLGIPLAALEGTDAYFGELLRANPELSFIAIGSGDRLIHVSGLQREAAERAIAQPAEAERILSAEVRQQGNLVAQVHLGVRTAHLDSRLAAIRLDILIVLSISLLIGYEVMRFVLSATLTRPLADVVAQMRALGGGTPLLTVPRGAMRRVSGALNALATGRGSTPATLRSRPVNQIRLLAFLFMFGEQLSRPFLPIFAKSLAGHAEAGLWASLPVSAFMLATALAMPILAPWSERTGRRRCFLSGAALAAGGMVGSAICLGLGDFIAWRVVTAVGYAMMFLACQGFVIDNTDDGNRARGVASFVGAIMVAELCAPGIGGILADHVGERPVFALGAAITGVAAALAGLVLGGPAPRATADRKPGQVAALLRTPRYLLLLALAAIPAKFALTAFLFFLVPVGMATLGATPSETGRTALLYAVPSLLLAPWVARLADRHGCHGLLVGLGGMITGAGLLPLLFWADGTTMAIAVAALGLGQALSISPQLSMATQVCSAVVAQSGSAAMLGVYRFVERIGSALGPLAAGLLTVAFGPIEAAGILGAGLFLCAVAFSVTFLVIGTTAEPPDDESALAPEAAA